MPEIILSRVGEPDKSDGRRVLVDRLWPRGVSHERADWQEWLKDVAPSTELRRWYGHAPERRPEFERRYRLELADERHSQAIAHLAHLLEEGPLVLLTQTRDVEGSQLPTLRDFLLARLGVD